MAIRKLKTGPASNPFEGTPKPGAKTNDTGIKKYAGPARNKKADQRRSYAGAMKGRA